MNKETLQLLLPKYVGHKTLNFKQLYANKLDNIKEMDKFLKHGIYQDKIDKK